MTSLDNLKSERQKIRNLLKTVELQKDKESALCSVVGYSLDVSGGTVKNYLGGNIPDGLLAMHIYKEFKRLKFTKKQP